MLDRRSLVAWGKFLSWALPVIAAAATVISLADDVHNGLEEIKATQGVIRSVQDRITSEDAEIRATQSAIMRRFDKQDESNQRMAESLNARLQDFAFELGKVAAGTPQPETGYQKIVTPMGPFCRPQDAFPESCCEGAPMPCLTDAQNQDAPSAGKSARPVKLED